MNHRTIILIHGMFQNPVSWDGWVRCLEGEGYSCLAPAWPMHEGDPAALREHPPEGLGDLRLDEVVSSLETVVRAQPVPPVGVGHSVGGLIVQLLADRGLVSLGVSLNGVASNGAMTMDWDFLKNSARIGNPLKGDEPFFTDPEAFHKLFCNTMTKQEAREAFDRTAVHDSRNVLRDCMGDSGQIDQDKPHVPLLFISGSEDIIIPARLVEKNAHAYTDGDSVVDTREFAGRSHFTCGQSGWEHVVDYVGNWIAKHLPPSPGQGEIQV
ncbi:alpha/beta hydrolase [soil metagenome]